MSNRAISKVLAADIRPAALKLTAFVMADTCDEDGGSLFPSMQQVAWWTGLSRCQAQRQVRELIALGVLKVIGSDRGGAPGSTTRYRLDFSTLDSLPRIPNRDSANATPTGSAYATGSADAMGERGSAHAQEGSHGCTGGVAPMHKRGRAHATQSPSYPPVNPQVPPKVPDTTDTAPTPDLFGSAEADPIPEVVKATKSVKAKKPKPETPTTATRAAFIEAYTERYGVAPVLAAKQNGQLAQLVRTLGAEEAPDVARFFLRSDRQVYLNRTHDLGLLLQDAGSLRTQWKAGFTAPEGYGRSAPAGSLAKADRVARLLGMTDADREAANAAARRDALQSLRKDRAGGDVIDAPTRVVRPGRDFSGTDYTEGLPHEQQ